MDRFIGVGKRINLVTVRPLKSNMDRFIARKGGMYRLHIQL